MPYRFTSAADVAQEAISEGSNINGDRQMTPKTAAMIASLATQIHNIDTNQGAIATRLSNLETSIRTEFDALGKAISEGRQTRWQTVFTGLGVVVAVLVAFGTVAYLPVKEGMETNANALHTLAGDTNRRFDLMVPRSEHEAKWAEEERRFGAIVARLNDYENKYVEHREYAEHSAAAERRLDALSARLNHDEDQLHGNLQEQLRSANNRIQQLEGSLLNNRRPENSQLQPQ